MDDLDDLLLRAANKALGADLRQDQLSDDASFGELGVDSLFLAQIAYGVLRELDLYVPIGEIADCQTLGQFKALIRREAAAAGLSLGTAR